jgi:hypothetical protein
MDRSHLRAGRRAGVAGPRPRTCATIGTIIDVCASTGSGPTRKYYLDRPAITGADDRGGAMALLASMEMATATFRGGCYRCSAANTAAPRRARIGIQNDVHRHDVEHRVERRFRAKSAHEHTGRQRGQNFRSDAASDEDTARRHRSEREVAASAPYALTNRSSVSTHMRHVPANPALVICAGASGSSGSIAAAQG